MPKRIRYVPGLISLVFLLPACVLWLNAHHAFKRQRCFSLTFKAPLYESWDDPQLPEPPPPPPDLSKADLRWSSFSMDGHLGSNQYALKAFQDSLRQVESSESMDTGLHVHFGKTATYGTVMAALEICRSTVNAYFIDDHDLWAAYVPIHARPTTSDQQGQAFACLFYDDVVQIPSPATGRRWFSKLLDPQPAISIPRELWPIAAVLSSLDRRSLLDASSIVAIGLKTKKPRSLGAFQFGSVVITLERSVHRSSSVSQASRSHGWVHARTHTSVRCRPARASGAWHVAG